MTETVEPDAAPPQSVGRPLGSILALTGFSVGQILLQFAFQMYLAAQFGAARDLDAFVAAQTVPLLVSTVLAGSLGLVFVPALARIAAERDAVGVRRFVRSVSTLLLVASMAAAVAGFVAAPVIRAVLVPGFDVEAAARTEALLRMLVWLIPLQCIAAFARSLHQSREWFVVTGLGGVATGGVTLFVAWLLAESWGTTGVATASLAGGVAGLVVMTTPVIRDLLPRRSIDPVTWTALAALWPLLIAAGLQQTDAVVDRHLSSRLAEGTVSHLSFATRLSAAMFTIGSHGLAFVAFPAFARHAARGDDEALSRHVSQTLRGMAFVFIPLTAGLACFATPVVKLLFERRAFDAADTRAVALLVVALSGFLVGGAIGEVLGRLLYARNRAWIGTVLAALALTVGTTLKLLLLPGMGVTALALATSLVYLLNAGLLLLWAGASFGGNIFRGVGPTMFRSIVATIAALASAFAIVGWARLGVVPGALLAAIVYVSCCAWLGERLVDSERSVEDEAATPTEAGS